MAGSGREKPLRWRSKMEGYQRSLDAAGQAGWVGRALVEDVKDSRRMMV